MTEFEKYIKRYLDLAQGDLKEILKENQENCTRIFNQLKSNQDYSYADGKWNIKCLLQHIIDCEKIFAYRALCISRGETQNLPGFNENIYAENSKSINTNLEDLITEFNLLRTINLMFFKALNNDDLQKIGLCNQNPISVENLGRLIIGHCYHHLNVLKNLYLPNLDISQQ